MPYDPFNTDSGLIDHYTGIVEESWFGVNPEYNENLSLLFWRIKLDEPDEFPQIEEGAIQEQFTLGPSWESLDGGETIEYPGNDKKGIQSNSQYGKIIRRAVDEWGMRPTLEGRGGDPRQGSIWVGLRFEFQAETQPKFKNRQTGEWVEPRAKVMPVRWIGEDEIPPPEKAVDISVVLDLDPEQFSELRQIADEVKTGGEFLDRAMKLQWVADNGSLISALAEPRLWEALTKLS